MKATVTGKILWKKMLAKNYRERSVMLTKMDFASPNIAREVGIH